MRTWEELNTGQKAARVVLLIGFSIFMLWIFGSVFTHFLFDDYNTYDKRPDLVQGAVQETVEAKVQETKQEEKTISIYISDLPYGVDSKYKNAFREVMAELEKVGVNFKEVSSKRDADVVVDWVKEFGTKTLGHTIYLDFIEIGLGDSYCRGEWRPYNFDTIKHLAMHELGHTFGLKDDYENPDKVMYYKVKTVYESEIDKEEVLPLDFAKFYPFCTTEEETLYEIKISSSEPINIWVVDSKEQFNKAANDEKFTYYKKCGVGETTYFNKVCPGDKGGGIIIMPSEFGPSPKMDVYIAEVTDFSKLSIE